MEPRLLGFIAGDGWCYYERAGRKYLVGFTQNSCKMEIVSIYASLLSRYGKIRIKRKKRNALDVYVQSKTLYKRVRLLIDNIAKYFERLTTSEKVAFIGGFIDAEACVEEKRCRIFNKNLYLLESIRRFLRDNGINSYLYWDKNVFVLEVKYSNFPKLVALVGRYSVKIAARCAPYTRA